jgi:hypothetical protein
MSLKEALEWIRGERSSLNYMPRDPEDTYHVRIAQTDAAMIQQAYYVLKAHKEGLLTVTNEQQ